jgi:hypothetical protein
MSELRDLTNALRAIDKRLSGVERCLLVVIRNSEQQAEWRHEQRNRAQIEDGLQSARERAIQQVQSACGAISHKLAEVVERLDNQAATYLANEREIRNRVRQLETGEEVTK